MVNKRMHTGDIVSPIQSLENYFLKGEVTILQAAFEHSFFLDPDKVRVKTPYFSDRARYSREHYPGLKRGDSATWNGDGRSVRLDDNSSAQRAWSAYSERPIERGSGYGVRHIWGHPWDPGTFTAGWNLCYMPFWVGLLTEKQHPYPPKEHEPFSTDKVKASAKSDVRRILRETELDLAQLEDLLDKEGL